MAKHKYIETPEKLFEFFKEYEKDVKSNPRTEHVFIGKDGISERKELERPLTLEGFYEFVCDHEETKFNTDYPDLSDYFENKDNRYAEYVRICLRIKRRIRRDQIEGGMVGQYNASITQRLNGLKDQTDVTTQGEKIESKVVVKIGTKKND